MIKLFHLLQGEVDRIELKLAQRLEQRLNQPYSSSIFYFSIISLNFYLVFWQVVTDFYKFLIINIADPGESFNLFFHQRELRSCPFSYASYKKVQAKVRLFSAAGVTAIVAVSVATSLITNLLFGGKQPGFAATYPFIQTNWSGGLSAASAEHDTANNQATQNWNAFSASSSNIFLANAGNDLQINPLSSSTAQTDETAAASGFNQAGVVTSSAVVSGIGTAASVKLDQQNVYNTGTTTDDSSATSTLSQPGGWGYGTFSNTVQNGLIGSGASVILANTQSNPFLNVFATATPKQTNSSAWPYVAIDAAGNIYSVDQVSSAGKIKKYNSSGGLVATISVSGFDLPTGLAVDNSSGTIYYLHAGAAIKKCTSNNGINGTSYSCGAFVANIGGSTIAQAIAVDSAGNVYTSNRVIISSGVIAKYNSAGTLVTSFGGGIYTGIKVDASGNVYAVKGGAFQKYVPDSGGVNANSYSLNTTWGMSTSGHDSIGASDLALDSSGNVYLSANAFTCTLVQDDPESENLGDCLAGDNFPGYQKYTQTGILLTDYINPVGAGNGQFQNAASLAIDQSDNLYIADSSLQRIQKFGPSIITYPISGTQTYTSFIDGNSPTVTWTSFNWDGSFSGGQTTIAFKILGTGSTAKPSDAAFDASVCAISPTSADGVYFIDQACSAVLAGSRYLWYQATLKTTDNLNSPHLEGISATAITSFAYFDSGTYTSNAVSVGNMASWRTLAWNAAVPASTSLTVRVRSGVDAVMTGANNWTAACNVASGADLSGISCVHVGDQFIQYQAAFTTSDNTQTPSLNDITINYNYYPTGQYLVSSAYDTGTDGNLMGALSWIEDDSIAAGTNVILSLRTAGTFASLSAAAWVDFSNASTNCTKSAGTVSCPSSALQAASDLLNDGIDDQWFQYKVTLGSNGAQTPTVSQVQVAYVVNAPPQLDQAYGIQASQDADGTVLISYKPRDPDTTYGTATYLGEPNVGKVWPSFEYSLDNGANWAVIATGLSANATTSKAVDTDAGRIASGTTMYGDPANGFAAYFVSWNPSGANATSSQAKIRVSVSDHEAANASAALVSDSFILDAQAPTLGTHPLLINGMTDPAALTLSATDDNAMEMRIGQTADLSAAPWVAYAATSSIILTGTSTAYVQFKDAFNNITEVVSTALPERPTAMMIQDTSNLAVNEYRLFIAWKTVIDTGAFARYHVLKSADGTTYAELATIDDIATNYYGDNTLALDQAAYYQVATEDDDGNVSYLSAAVNGKANGVQDAGEGGGGTLSATPAVISNVATTSIFTTQAAIRWDTDLLSDSLVYYQTAAGGDFSSATSTGVATMRATANPYGQHEVILTGLTPATTYYFIVQSINAQGVVASSTAGTDGYSFSTPAGPAIIPGSVNRANIGNTTADISWQTDQDANSYVVFSTNPDLSGSVELGSSNAVSDHVVTLFGLAPNQNYYFYVRSANARGYDTGGAPFVFSTTKDLTPPTISGLAASATDHSAVIQFATAKPATSTVTVTNRDMPAESYTTVISTLNTSHLFDFSGLAANTLYDVAITAEDANGNTDTDSASFTTLAAPDTAAPVISSLATTTSQTGAVISWTTDENATGFVEYATTSATSTFNSSYQQVGRSDYTLSHTVTLEGLTPNITYYFRVKSSDASNNTATDPATETFRSFQAVLQPLAVTNVATSTVTSDSSVVVWSTNHAADSRIVYGTTTGVYAFAQANPAVTAEHVIVLQALASSTTYYFRAVSNDALGQTATSSEHSFTTTASISPADYQAKVDEINGLLAQLAAASLDQGLSAAQVASLQAQVADLQQQLAAANNKGGGGVLVIDKTDKTPPAISDIRATDIKADSAIVSWMTNELADSFVKYGTSTSYGEYAGYSQLFASHRFNLKNLLPATAYHYQVESKDASGNLAASSDFSFVTPTLEQQLISEGKTDQEIKALAEEAAKSDENKANILLAAAQKAMEIMSQVANQVSLGTLESTLMSQFDTIEKLAQAIPGPILGGQPAVVAGASTAQVSWVTDKDANSLVAYAPEDNYLPDTYLQVVGEANGLTKVHQVKVAGLKPDTTYHFQLRSKAPLGPEAKSRDFTFRTKEETLEIVSYTNQNISADRATFRWSTNLESAGELEYTPYRSNKLSVEDTKVIADKPLSTRHEVTVDTLEPGTLYKVVMRAKDQKGRTDEAVLDPFSTSKDNLPPQIDNVQTESALSQGKQLKVQTIVSWVTNEPTIGEVQYVKGVASTDADFPNKTQLETTYSRKHVAVITKFDSGEVYSFRINATDSSGNTITSKTYTVLTPKQKESVFQLILKNFEDIFGWVGKVGN